MTTRLKIIMLLLLGGASAALGQTPLQPQTISPYGTYTSNAVNIQADPLHPIPITGVISVSGTADTPTAPVTFTGNNQCTNTLLTAGEQSAGFQANAGSLDATFTAFGIGTTATVNCATSGTCTTLAFNTGSTLVVTAASLTQNVQINGFGGLRQVMVCTTTYNSGSSTGFTVATFLQGLTSSGGGGGTVTQGNAGSNAQAWWTRIGDTTNGPVAVKAASTPVAATDKVLAVGISPNNAVTVVGAAASGAAKSGNPVQTGIVFNTTQPTVTNAQVVEAQGTARGAQIVAPGVDNFAVQASQAGSWTVSVTGSVTVTGTIAVTQSTSPWVDNITQLGGNAIAVGNGVTTTGTQRVTLSSDSTGVIGATQVGSWTVTTSPPANASTNVTQLAGNATQTGNGTTGTGTLRVTLSSDSTGTVAATQSGAWTVAATQSGTWNINNISGTVSLPTGAATDASVVALEVAQGSTTSGQKGILGQCAVTTSAPTYTTGQTAPCSLDTTGNLRITGSISATNPSVSATGSAVPASATYFGANKAGALVGATLDASGNLNVNVAAGGGSGGTSSSFGGAFPGTGTAGGFNDGTNMQGARVADTDSGAGTHYTLESYLVTPSSGGPVQFGTGTAPIRIDPTGTTPQPVTQSGSWTVSGSGTFTVAGTLTNNNAAPGAANIGALVALANSAAPTYTNGDQVLLSTDLSGNLRVTFGGTQTVQGAGTAGAPNGGVLTVQPPASGSTPFLISGTLTPLDIPGALQALSTACATGVSCASTAVAIVQMAGQQSANITFSTGATPLMTVVGDCAMDGGTAYQLTSSPSTSGLLWFGKSDGTLSNSIVNPGNTSYSLILPQDCEGATTVRIRVAALTSGTVNAQARGVFNPQVSYAGAIGANSYPPNAVAMMMQDSSTATTSRAVQGSVNGMFVASPTAANFLATVIAAGDVANGSSNSGNPLQIGGRAASTVTTAVTDGQRVSAQFNLHGDLVIVPQGDRAIITQNTVTLTASTAETTLLTAGGSGVFLDLTYLKCTTSSALGSTISIRDATGGTVRETIVCGLASGPCEGAVYNVPFKQTSANANWTIQSSASVTSVFCTAQAVQTK